MTIEKLQPAGVADAQWRTTVYVGNHTEWNSSTGWTNYYHFNGQQVAKRNSSGVFSPFGPHSGYTAITLRQAQGRPGQCVTGNKQRRPGAQPGAIVRSLPVGHTLRPATLGQWQLPVGLSLSGQRQSSFVTTSMSANE
jgi:hypothetical protein